MKLEQMTMKKLLALHNEIADKPAGPKTFSTRSKLVARIGQIAEAKNIDLTSFGQRKPPEAVIKRAQPRIEAAEAIRVRPDEAKKSAGKGIGALAREILMDPTGYPHALVAAMVNAQIDGAAATAKSVRWYASDMRRRGLDVPPRAKVHPAFMDEEQSAAALSTVRVVEPAPSKG